MSKLNRLKDLEADDVLEHLGLQRRRTAADWLLPGLGLFGLGVIVGAGLGLMLAPKPGSELRQDLKERLQGGEARGVVPGPTSAAERPSRTA